MIKKFDLDKLNSHIFPFLWVHGESHEQLLNEINAIHNAGINMFCVESRPHPQFCEGEKWWEDFEFILSVAKELGMKVWLLDDKHFPTGYAVGSVEKNPNLKQKNIRMFFVDFIGDGEPCKFIINDDNEDIPIGAYLFQRSGDDIIFESGEDVSSCIDGQVLSLKSCKTGFLRLVVLFETTRFFELENYIDMLNPDSVDLQIKTVYEPTYNHFKDYFGDTFIGFFSDEPRFSNGRSEPNWMLKTMYQTQVGQIGCTYPYRSDLHQLLNIDKKLFVCLWFDAGEISAEFRIQYMDVITNLYRDNFSLKLAKWCSERGVLYTGHVTEDMGNHTKLGSGTGHFFRSMKGQDLAGIDVVLHQIERGFSRHKHIYPCPELYDNPDFFHFTLPKLAVSAAHLEKNKQNRAMCEIFGAYGWGESIEFMKWLVDFMLVRGINYFVPHAFNPKTDDFDCPPYFYHDGKNPLYPAFCELMKYVEDKCGILSKDYNVKVAVLYHAESEWSGLEYQSIDKVCRFLTENQIDFEIVPSEYLEETQANILLVPFGKYFGHRVENALKTFNGETIFVDENNFEDIIDKLPREYYLKNSDPYVRVLLRDNFFFVFNEGLNTSDNSILYKGNEYSFKICSNEAILIDANDFKGKESSKGEIELCELSKTYTKDFREENFNYIGKTVCSDDIRDRQGYSDFCGTVRYVFNFECDSLRKKTYIHCQTNGNAIKIIVNDKEAGYILGAPYEIDISSLIIEGNNEIMVELSTTLALYYKDMFSKYCKIDKCGLVDKPRLIFF